MKQNKNKVFAVLSLLLFSAITYAQSGVAALGSATTELATYWQPVSDLCLIIGAIIGLAGGIRVYMKWNSGDHEVQKEVIGWMGSCIFLIMTGTIIRAFFIP